LQRLLQRLLFFDLLQRFLQTLLLLLLLKRRRRRALLLLLRLTRRRRLLLDLRARLDLLRAALLAFLTQRLLQARVLHLL